ncbi:hypothetical protein ACPA9J_24370, partial [Pseudomonas aeruginosa]
PDTARSGRPVGVETASPSCPRQPAAGGRRGLPGNAPAIPQLLPRSGRRRRLAGGQPGPANGNPQQDRSSTTSWPGSDYPTRPRADGERPSGGAGRATSTWCPATSISTTRS